MSRVLLRHSSRGRKRRPGGPRRCRRREDPEDRAGGRVSRGEGKERKALTGPDRRHSVTVARRNQRIPILAVATFASLGVAFTSVPASGADYDVKLVPIPGATPAGVTMDYIAFDPSTRYVWAPAGNTGTVAVVDTSNGAVKSIGGFPTAEMGSGDRKRVVGPSSVTIGDKIVYIGNRADSKVCAFDPRTFAKGACHHLDSMADGLAFVPGSSEVWVTTPRDKSIRILDAATLDEKAKVTFDGQPEGFAVDPKRNRFYTNLEDKDVTLAID